MVERRGGKVEPVPQLTIRNPEAIRLARELAEREGKRLTAFVHDAVRERYERDHPAEFRESRTQYWLEYGKRMRETANPE